MYFRCDLKKAINSFLLTGVYATGNKISHTWSKCVTYCRLTISSETVSLTENGPVCSEVIAYRHIFDFGLTRTTVCYVTETRKPSMNCEYLSALNTAGCFQEMLLSPVQFGIPNSRLRYYLLAKLSPRRFPFATSSEVKKIEFNVHFSTQNPTYG